MHICKPDPKDLMQGFQGSFHKRLFLKHIKNLVSKQQHPFEEGLRKTIDWYREMSNVKT